MSFRNVQMTTSLPPAGQDNAGFGSYTAFQPGTDVWLTLPGGKPEMFTFDPQPFNEDNEFQSLSGIQLWVPHFDPGPGVTDTLSVPDADDDLMMQFGDGFVGAGDLENYNPADPEFGGSYTLTTHSGDSITIDPTQGVIDSVQDLNNNTLTYTNNGVFSSSGATLTFTRDYRGRITSAIATNANGTQAGQPILYQYDNNGNLVSVTDPAGQTTSYSYGAGGAPFITSPASPIRKGMPCSPPTMIRPLTASLGY